MTFQDALRGNTYPGRGILLGRSEDGQSAVIVYFIMGRSVNSRNRVFAVTDDGIRTEAFDPALLTDPTLVIYAPVRRVGTDTVVTNGDQTDTIRDALLAGGSFEQALRTRTFEPDGPNYTPRISGILHADGQYTLSILKSMDGDPAHLQRAFFEYPQPKPGFGHFIHTYAGDGNPLPSFTGEPELVAISGALEPFAESVWQALNADNKVSLFVRYMGADGESETVIYNKNRRNA